MKFNIEAISKHRSALMGFAMLWVVLYHYHLTGILSYPLGNGFTGVDIFMLVSGFGVYYSMQKNGDVVDFWKRRALRIFPTYILIGLAVSLLMGTFKLPNFIWSYSTLAFWINQQGDWFIPSIVFLYFIFPFLYHTIFKTGQLKSLIAIVVLLIFFIFYNCYVDVEVMDTRHFLLLYRIPIFMLGAVLAHIIFTPPYKHQQKSISLA